MKTEDHVFPTRKDLEVRLRGRTPVAPRSDYDLGPYSDGTPPWVNNPKPAAVLVPIIERRNQLSVVLTKRTHDLSTHAGQIAFPGGRIDATDPTPIDAALREAHEEVGLHPRHVDVVGHLDEYRTGTGFIITPVVGFVPASSVFTPNPAEVEEVFEVPLDFLLDPANRQRHAREWAGHIRHFYAMPYGDYYIWGATAGMIVNLSDLVRG